MKQRVLILFFLGLLSQEGYRPVVALPRSYATPQAELIEDSEVGYTLKYHSGDMRNWGKGSPPDKNDYVAVCWKGSVKRRIIGLWNDGKKEESRQRRLTLKNYLKLWRILEECRVWELESPMDVLKRIKSPEEDPYFVFNNDQEWWQFRFRIGSKEHRFELYFIQGLKDKRYLRVLKEINRFLKVKNVKINKMALSTAHIK